MPSGQASVGRETQPESRFGFGQNWSSFSTHVDDARVSEAVESISSQLGGLAGRRFIDAGCGSGLFSLAAVRLGAAQVLSFDYDDESVTTTSRLKERFNREATSWVIERGDVLDGDYVDALGQWDVVYSWGVLHHTGNMRKAWSNVARLVAPGGRLWVSIYNDQGWRSRAWSVIKSTYQRIPGRLRPAYVVLVMAPREALSLLLKGPTAYWRQWRQYKSNRGMSRWHDLVDWVGGHPFEVAKPEEVFGFFRSQGFALDWMVTCGGSSGCNQFLFTRVEEG